MNKDFKSGLFYLTLVLLGLNTLTNAQTTVRGKVVDTAIVPVPYATIALLKEADSSIVKGVLTSEDGSYVITGVIKGSYLLKVFIIGYRDAYVPGIHADSNSIVEVPTISLKPKDKNLKEVSVTAIRQTIEFNNGNITVNVESSPLAKGNTVYDLLYKLPGVSLDGNTISLQGKSGVTVLIDGRVQPLSNLQLINLLKSMNSEQVEKIEILKNPPVKYDASGTSGIIDIKTRTVKSVGLSGSAYFSGAKGLYGDAMPGVSLNYKGQKIRLFSGVGYNYTSVEAVEKFDRTFSETAGQTMFTGQNVRIQLGTSYDYRLGADWDINAKNTIGFKVDGENGSTNTNGNGTNTVSGYNNLGFDHLSSGLQLPDQWNLTNFNINAEHRYDTVGTTLNFASDYTTFSDQMFSYNQSYFLDPLSNQVLPPNIYRSKDNSNSQIFSSRLDFNKYLNPNSFWEGGMKFSRVDVTNNFLFERENDNLGSFYTDTSQTNNFSYSETTEAAYLNYRKSYKKLNYQLGMRGENTVLQGKNTLKNFELDKSYFNLFPNISLEYTASENNSFLLNLNRRIDRPPYDNLNPFRFYRDQYSYFTGNPYLLPHYRNAIELTHNYKKALISSFSYARIENMMMGYTSQNDTSRVLVESIKNINYSETYTYSLFYQNQLKPWWAISANAVISYIDYKGDIHGIPFLTSGVYYNGYLNNTFILPGKIKLEINGFYRGPKCNGIVVARAWGMVSMALKKSFLKDKLDISLGINDLFYSQIFRSYSNFATQNWNYYTTADTRRGIISINYNFGRIKVTEQERSSDQSEKERLKH